MLKNILKKMTFPIAIILLFSGCRNLEKYRKERVAKAGTSINDIKSNDLPHDAVISLPFCIQTALSNNLNIRIYDLKEAVNNERKTAAALGMLPDVIVTNDISYRTNQPGASSYNIATGTESLAPSQSAQDYENRVRVEFLFSFIDFGLAYFNAVQARDRTLITAEERRRAVQNLILDVSRAYFKVAAAQYAMDKTEKMIEIALETEDFLDQMVKDKRLPLEKLMTEKKTLLVLKRSLMEYKRSYENSCIELKTLMGYYPNEKVLVDTSGMKDIVEPKIPDIELLEEIALLERPELYQLDMQHHITAVAARKKVVEMFPNVGLFTDFTNSTNKFLYNQSWWELGARAAYRLLRVPQQIGEYVAIESEMEQIDMQVNALSAGILSQVRIAYANLLEVRERYAISEQLYSTYLKHENIKEDQAKTAGALSKIELNRLKMETTEKDIERTQALGNYYVAYFRLLNSAGLQSFDEETVKTIKERISDSFLETKEGEIEKISICKAELQDINNQIEEINSRIKNGTEVSIVSGTEQLNKNEAEINNLNTNYSIIENEFLKVAGEKLEQLNASLEEYKQKVKNDNIAIESNKNFYDAKIADLESEYKNKLAEISMNGVKDEALEDQIKNKYEFEIKDTRKSYGEIKDSITARIAEHKEKIAELQKMIDDENNDIQNVTMQNKDKYQDKIEKLQKIRKSESNKLESYRKSLAEYKNNLEKLKAKKADLEKQLEESAGVIDEHNIKLAKYITAIELLNESK